MNNYLDIGDWIELEIVFFLDHFNKYNLCYDVPFLLLYYKLHKCTEVGLLFYSWLPVRTVMSKYDFSYQI